MWFQLKASIRPLVSKMQMAQIAHVNLHELERTLYFNSCLHADFSLARCIIASETAAPACRRTLFAESERGAKAAGAWAHTQSTLGGDIKAPLLLFDVIDAPLCSALILMPCHCYCNSNVGTGLIKSGIESQYLHLVGLILHHHELSFMGLYTLSKRVIAWIM
jgi:hypothetical protein